MPANRIQCDAHRLQEPTLLTATWERDALIDHVQAGGAQDGVPANYNPPGSAYKPNA
jgi:hypothetical protein